MAGAHTTTQGAERRSGHKKVPPRRLAAAGGGTGRGGGRTSDVTEYGAFAEDLRPPPQFFIHRRAKAARYPWTCASCPARAAAAASGEGEPPRTRAARLRSRTCPRDSGPLARNA